MTLPDINPLISPPRVWTRSEVLSIPCLVPKLRGVYAWFFKEIPPCIVSDDCINWENLKLLYVGISPSSPQSKQNLYKRIRFHYRGNAEGSTLRLTLGCLLSEKLGIQLRRVGSGKSMTFTTGEGTLSEWMEENAFVVWVEQQEPWILEEQLIQQLFLPLNLELNHNNPNYQVVSKFRCSAKALARSLPVNE